MIIDIIKNLNQLVESIFENPSIIIELVKTNMGKFYADEIESKLLSEMDLEEEDDEDDESEGDFAEEGDAEDYNGGTYTNMDHE